MSPESEGQRLEVTGVWWSLSLAGWLIWCSSLTSQTEGEGGREGGSREGGGR